MKCNTKNVLGGILMILCCKSCGHCFESNIQGKECDYCSGVTEVLFTEEEVKAVDKYELKQNQNKETPINTRNPSIYQRFKHFTHSKKSEQNFKKSIRLATN